MALLHADFRDGPDSRFPHGRDQIAAWAYSHPSAPAAAAAGAAAAVVAGEAASGVAGFPGPATAVRQSDAQSAEEAVRGLEEELMLHGMQLLDLEDALVRNHRAARLEREVIQVARCPF